MSKLMSLLLRFFPDKRKECNEIDGYIDKYYLRKDDILEDLKKLSKKIDKLQEKNGGIY